MKEFWSILRCFLGIHRWRIEATQDVGLKYHNYCYVTHSGLCESCERCLKRRFRIVPGAWKLKEAPTAKEKEEAELRKMAGLQ